jgi:VIT1/CCC1 family predicted Fe2+/Mn2+ transporter
VEQRQDVRAAPTDADLARWRRNLQHEWANAATMRTLAARTANPARAAVMERLAAQETHQADYWSEKLRAAGAAVPAPQPHWHDHLLLGMARRFGPRAVLPLMAAHALRGAEHYRGQPDAAALVSSESAVAKGVAALVYGDTAAETVEAGREHRRSTAGNGSLRAAVFGINDGLTSNLALVMGVAGAAPDNQWILLSGLAGLLAGAFSMGGGEFISMLSQKELFEKELALEREHIRTDPAGEEANLARVYEDKGLPGEQARVVAAQLMADPAVALDTIAREQLGLNPDELGSPPAAAGASFVSFAIGATLPILPFLFLHSHLAVLVGFLLSGVGLFLVGAALSLFTARNPVLSGLRMLSIGLGAALLTYLIGRAIGVSVAG